MARFVFLFLLATGFVVYSYSPIQAKPQGSAELKASPWMGYQRVRAQLRAAAGFNVIGNRDAEGGDKPPEDDGPNGEPDEGPAQKKKDNKNKPDKPQSDEVEAPTASNEGVESTGGNRAILTLIIIFSWLAVAGYFIYKAVWSFPAEIDKKYAEIEAAEIAKIKAESAPKTPTESTSAPTSPGPHRSASKV